MDISDKTKLINSEEKAKYIKKAVYELFFYAFIASNASSMLLAQAIKDPNNAVLKYGIFALILTTIWILFFIAKKHIKKIGNI